MNDDDLKAILFDADGVIQVTPPAFIEAIHALVDSTADAAAFVSDIFLAERETLTGAGEFPMALGRVLEQWRVEVPVDEALQIWSLIHPVPGVRELIVSLEVPCYLASNQQRHRGEYMSTALGYGEIFDAEFYSYRLGVMKPSVEFFSKIIDELDCSPKALLFIDDHQQNVVAATELGIRGVQFDLRQEDDPLAALTSVLREQGALAPRA